MKVRLSAAARRDLDDIWDHTAQRWDTAQADRYVRQLAQGFDDLGSGTAVGRSAEEIRPGYRKLGVGAHLIFSRMAGEIVQVVRILHRRMDVDRHL